MLALLQEEVVEPHRCKDIKRKDAPTLFKPPAARDAFPLPPPPRQALAALIADDKRAPDDRRPPNDHRPPLRRTPVDDKLQSLRSYHMACGLYMRCGEKWHQGHKCTPALQLHALQQVRARCVDAFSDDTLSEPAALIEEEQDQAFMLLSASATSIAMHPHTLQFEGFIQGKPVMILIDTGSTHSFLDS